MADVQIDTTQVRSLFSARAFALGGTIHPGDQGYYVLGNAYNRVFYHIRSFNAATNLNCKVRGSLVPVIVGAIPDDDRFNIIPGSVAGVPGYWGAVSGLLGYLWIQNNAASDIFVDLTVFTEGVDR